MINFLSQLSELFVINFAYSLLFLPLIIGENYCGNSIQEFI